MLFKCSLLSLLLALSVGCKTLPLKDEPDYGLLRVSLSMSPEELGTLKNSVGSKDPVVADIHIPGHLKVTCRVSYAGRSSLDDYRKSFNLYFCGQRFRKRSGYRLSAQSIDQSLMRSLLGYPLFSSLGLMTPRVEQVAAYLNRSYLGLYLLLEKIDNQFFVVRDKSVGEIYKAQFGNSGFTQDFASRLKEAFSEESSSESYSLLEQLYLSLWQTTDDQLFLQEIQGFFDVEAFMNYAAAAVYLCHWDGLNNNFYLAFDKNTQKLVTVPWDLDRIWEKTSQYQPDDIVATNALLQRLLKIREPRQMYKQALDQLGKNFDQTTLKNRIEAISLESQAAFMEDRVLSRLSSIDGRRLELEQNTSEWLEKVSKYRATFDASD